MDDQNVVDRVVAVALGLVLVAALAWQLGSPSPGTSRGNDQVHGSAPADSANSAARRRTPIEAS